VAPAPVGAGEAAQAAESAARRAVWRVSAEALQVGGAGRREQAVVSPGWVAVVAARRAPPADRRAPGVEQQVRQADQQAPRGDLPVPRADQRERVVVAPEWEAAAAARRAPLVDQQAPAAEQRAPVAPSLARAVAAVALPAWAEGLAPLPARAEGRAPLARAVAAARLVCRTRARSVACSIVR
jgi:hypothetical protein